MQEGRCSVHDGTAGAVEKYVEPGVSHVSYRAGPSVLITAKDFSVQFSFLHHPQTHHIMAKGQGKRSSDANEAAPAAAVAAPAAESTVMPDESAFAGLRQKIEQRLKNQNQNSGKGKKNNNNNKAPVPSKDTSDKKGKPSPAKPSRPQDAAQSKKRDRNGEPIARVEKKSGKDQQDKPKGSKKLSSEETLRQEILAMGGTEEDLDLLAGVDSESEVEGETAKGDDDLRKQLASMLDAAGHVVPEDLADDEVEDVEDEEESDEEVDAEDSEDNAESSGPESDIEEEPAHKAKPELALPKEFQKLVSCGLFQPR